MHQFIQENNKYPADNTKGKISAQVFVEFIIEKDGTISNAKILAGAKPELDAEALRLVNMFPKWKPGKHKGNLVRCFFSIPIRFSIE